MPMYKLQVQDDDHHADIWRDVKSAEAREKLAVLFPVLVKMEQFQADRKRTRVIVMNPYQDIDQEKEE